MLLSAAQREGGARAVPLQRTRRAQAHVARRDMGFQPGNNLFMYTCYIVPLLTPHATTCVHLSDNFLSTGLVQLIYLFATNIIELIV